MTRRIYELDGKEIESSNVNGFIHKARTEKRCMSCDITIKKGDKYILLNVMGVDPICYDCYLGDNDPEPVILGVKIGRRSKYGVVRSLVICKSVTSKNWDEITSESSKKEETPA